jgi:hypothetical protein
VGAVAAVEEVLSAGGVVVEEGGGVLLSAVVLVVVAFAACVAPGAAAGGVSSAEALVAVAGVEFESGAVSAGVRSVVSVVVPEVPGDVFVASGDIASLVDDVDSEG